MSNPIIPLQSVVGSQGFVDAGPDDQMKIVTGWMSQASSNLAQTDEDLAKLGSAEYQVKDAILLSKLNRETAAILPEHLRSPENIDFTRRHVLRYHQALSAPWGGENPEVPKFQPRSYDGADLDYLAEEAIRGKMLPMLLPSERSKLNARLKEVSQANAELGEMFDASTFVHTEDDLYDDRGPEASVYSPKFEGDPEFKKLSERARNVIGEIDKHTQGFHLKTRWQWDGDDAGDLYAFKRKPTPDHMQVWQLKTPKGIREKKFDSLPKEKDLRDFLYEHLDDFPDERASDWSFDKQKALSERERIQAMYGKADPGWLEQGVDSLWRGAARVVGGVGSLLTTREDVVNERASWLTRIGLRVEQAADIVNAEHQMSREDIEAGGLGINPLSWDPSVVADKVINVAAMAGQLYYTGAWGGAALMSADAAGNTYREAFDHYQQEGLDPHRSDQLALQEGLISGGVTALVQGLTNKVILDNKFASTAIRNAVRKKLDTAAGAKGGLAEWIASGGKRQALGRGVTNFLSALPGDVAMATGGGAVQRASMLVAQDLIRGEGELAQEWNALTGALNLDNESFKKSMFIQGMFDDALFGTFAAATFGNLHPRGLGQSTDGLTSANRFQPHEGTDGSFGIPMGDFIARFGSRAEAEAFGTRLTRMQEAQEAIFERARDPNKTPESVNAKRANELATGWKLREGVPPEVVDEFKADMTRMEAEVNAMRGNSRLRTTPRGITRHDTLADAVRQAKRMANNFVLGRATTPEQVAAQLESGLVKEWAENYDFEPARLSYKNQFLRGGRTEQEAELASKRWLREARKAKSAEWSQKAKILVAEQLATSNIQFGSSLEGINRDPALASALKNFFQVREITNADTGEVHYETYFLQPEPIPGRQGPLAESAAGRAPVLEEGAQAREQREREVTESLTPRSQPGAIGPMGQEFSGESARSSAEAFGTGPLVIDLPQRGPIQNMVSEMTAHETKSAEEAAAAIATAVPRAGDTQLAVREAHMQQAELINRPALINAPDLAPPGEGEPSNQPPVVVRPAIESKRAIEAAYPVRTMIEDGIIVHGGRSAEEAAKFFDEVSDYTGEFQLELRATELAAEEAARRAQESTARKQAIRRAVQQEAPATAPQAETQAPKIESERPQIQPIQSSGEAPATQRTPLEGPKPASQEVSVPTAEPTPEPTPESTPEPTPITATPEPADERIVTNSQGRTFKVYTHRGKRVYEEITPEEPAQPEQPAPAAETPAPPVQEQPPPQAEPAPAVAPTTAQAVPAQPPAQAPAPVVPPVVQGPLPAQGQPAPLTQRQSREQAKREAIPPPKPRREPLPKTQAKAPELRIEAPPGTKVFFVSGKPRFIRQNMEDVTMPDGQVKQMPFWEEVHPDGKRTRFIGLTEQAAKDYLMSDFDKQYSPAERWADWVHEVKFDEGDIVTAEDLAEMSPEERAMFETPPARQSTDQPQPKPTPKTEPAPKQEAPKAQEADPATIPDEQVELDPSKIKIDLAEDHTGPGEAYDVTMGKRDLRLYEDEDGAWHVLSHDTGESQPLNYEGDLRGALIKLSRESGGVGMGVRGPKAGFRNQAGMFIPFHELAISALKAITGGQTFREYFKSMADRFGTVFRKAYSRVWEWMSRSLAEAMEDGLERIGGLQRVVPKGKGPGSPPPSGYNVSNPNSKLAQYLKNPHSTQQNQAVNLAISRASIGGSNSAFKSRAATMFPSVFRNKGDLPEFFDDKLDPVIDRLERIHPKLKGAMRFTYIETLREMDEYLKPMEPFLKKYRKIKNQTFRENLDLALFNGDTSMRDRLLAQMGMAGFGPTIQRVADTIHQRAKLSGLDIPYNRDYFPREVKDYDGLSKAMKGHEARPYVERALAEAISKQGPMSPWEEADFVNRWLQSEVQRFGRTPRNSKERKILALQTDLLKYYSNAGTSFMHYADRMARTNVYRRMFGHSKDYANLDQIKAGSFGGLLHELYRNGEINTAQHEEATGLIKSFLGSKPSSSFIGTVKGIGYLTTITDTVMALGQMTDLITGFAQNGIYGQLRGIETAARGTAAKALGIGLPKEFVQAADVGIHEIFTDMRELGPLESTSRFLQKVSGIKHIVEFGQAASLSGHLKYLQGKSVKELQEIVQPFEQWFHDRSTGTRKTANEVINEIKQGVVSPDVKMLLASRLMDFNFYSMLDAPRSYMDNPNGRLFYMMKMWSVRALGAIRREGISKIAQGDYKNGVKNLLYVGMTYALAGATYDQIKRALYGKDQDVPESVKLGFLGLVGVTPYHVDEINKGDVDSAVGSYLFGVPALGIIKNLIRSPKEATKISEDQNIGWWQALVQTKLMNNIPVAGRMAYWRQDAGQAKAREMEFESMKDQYDDSYEVHKTRRQQLRRLKTKLGDEFENQDELDSLNALFYVREKYEKQIKASLEKDDPATADQLTDALKRFPARGVDFWLMRKMDIQDAESANDLLQE